ncbi:hypothetical protein OQA88_5275 [Cercophora sp. LCS_1]
MDIAEDTRWYRSYRHVEDTEKLLPNQRQRADSNTQPHVTPVRETRGGRFPWWSVSWRFVCSVFFSIILMVILDSYAGRESLGTWDRRLFNMLTILFSSLVSLSLGSLLGLLGATLRWPLLASRKHAPDDVDLILGMSNPTGSLKLILHHCRRANKWSATTSIVLAYLVVNIIGRLSVAAFGLTYDLNENAGIDYPVMLPDFGAREWMKLETTDRDLGQMANFALSSFIVADTKYNQSDPSTYTMRNISGLGLDRSVDGDTVTYTYHLREHRGLDEYASSGLAFQSSSNCLGRNFYNGGIYEKGKLVATLPDDEDENAPEFVNVLNGILSYYGPATDYIWAKNWDYAKLGDPSACVTTYLHNEMYPSHQGRYTRNTTFFQCTTCLRGPSGSTGLSPNPFFNLPASKLPYAANILLSFGAFDRRYAYSYDVGQFSAKEYGSQEHAMTFINGLGAMRYKEFGADWYRTPVPKEYELHTAHLTARLPVLAVIGAEKQLPRVTREAGASEVPFIVTSLEVKWRRSMGVLGAILAGQVVVVWVVYWYVGGVWVRDHDSFLSVARVLRTAMAGVKGLSTGTGKKLAERIEESVSGMRYGTRKGKMGLEVDIWEDAVPEFPLGKYD